MSTAGMDLTRRAIAERDQQIAALVRAGYSADRIAVKLAVSRRTVERYKAWRRRAGGRP